MRIPHSISPNVLVTYRCSPETVALPREQGRTLRAEDASWDDDAVPELKVLALRVIVSIWKDYPLLKALPTCVDRDVLLETLPTDLPFELTITRLKDGIYWERAAKDRWTYNNPGEHGDSWRQLYCERHLAEYLETLDANYFEPQKEECAKLIRLLRDYVRVLRIRSLVATIPPSQQISVENDRNEKHLKWDDVVHHIAMGIVLPQLPNLTELYLNFATIYMDDGFEWRDFEFSLEDCLSLGQGIKASPKLRKFSLTRSNLNRPRAAAVLQGVVANDNIEYLDLSHCKLADEGAHAVGQFLSMHQTLRKINLTNNNVGPKGMAGLVHGILKAKSSALMDLDLRLNPLQDEGATYVCALLLRNTVLESLNISGCGITAEGGIAMAEVLSSGCVPLKALSLDLSNNDLGPNAGEMLDEVVQAWPYIIQLDGRMCNFSTASQQSINTHAHRNKQNVRRERNVMTFYHRRIIADMVDQLREPLSEIDSTFVTPQVDVNQQISPEEQEIMKSILKTRPTRRVY